MVSASGKPFVWRKLVPELDVSDFERSVRFYTEVLGFEILFSREKFVYLELEEVQFMLQQTDNDGWQTGVLEPPFGRGINFQIELEDVGPLYQRLQEVGHPFFREVKDSWYKTGDVLSGQREFLIQDPDGYLLRFCQAIGTVAESA